MTEQVPTIVIVCRGNIARSPFAAEMIKQELTRRGLIDKFDVLSRGVQGTAVDPRPVMYPNITMYEQLYKDSKAALDAHGIDLSRHQSQAIHNDDATAASLLLAMDGQTAQALTTLFPEHAHKVHLFSELVGSRHDIADPEGVTGAERQARIFDEIHQTITIGFLQLRALAEYKITRSGL